MYGRVLAQYRTAVLVDQANRQKGGKRVRLGRSVETGLRSAATANVLNQNWHEFMARSERQLRARTKSGAESLSATGLALDACLHNNQSDNIHISSRDERLPCINTSLLHTQPSLLYYLVFRQRQSHQDRLSTCSDNRSIQPSPSFVSPSPSTF